MSCIYVARGRGGIVKVGRTKDVKRRLSSLKQEFKRLGDEFERIEYFPVADQETADVAERRLLSKISEVFTPYYGREWFIGSFESALQAAEIASAEACLRRIVRIRRMTPEETAALVARKEAKARAAQEWREQRIRGVAERKALRERRRVEIATRIALKAGLVLAPQVPAKEGASHA